MRLNSTTITLYFSTKPQVFPFLQLDEFVEYLKEFCQEGEYDDYKSPYNFHLNAMDSNAVDSNANSTDSPDIDATGKSAKMRYREICVKPEPIDVDAANSPTNRDTPSKSVQRRRTAEDRDDEDEEADPPIDLLKHVDTLIRDGVSRSTNVLDIEAISASTSLRQHDPLYQIFPMKELYEINELYELIEDKV